MPIKNLLQYLFYCGICFLWYSESLAQKNLSSNFKASFSIKDSKNRKILLTNKPASGIQSNFKVDTFDSSVNLTDTFSFEFFVKEPTWYSIEFEGVNGWKSFVATPNGNIWISGNANSLYNSDIKGSKEDSLYNEIVENFLKPIYKKMNTASPDSFKNIYPKIIKQFKYDFIKQNPNSFMSAWYIVEGDSYTLNNDTASLHFVQKLYEALGDKAKEFSAAKNAYYKLFVARNILNRGNKIPNFEILNYNNETFNLYNFLDKNKRKYYLIDFWAVWCKPCIAQFPKFTEIYNKYSSIGFDLIGFSFDVDKYKYQEFTNKNPLNWLNITDLQGSKSEIYKLFNINAIPANFLIDSDKNIIEVNLEQEKLAKFLAENLQ